MSNQYRGKAADIEQAALTDVDSSAKLVEASLGRFESAYRREPSASQPQPLHILEKLAGMTAYLVFGGYLIGVIFYEAYLRYFLPGVSFAFTFQGVALSVVTDRVIGWTILLPLLLLAPLIFYKQGNPARAEFSEMARCCASAASAARRGRRLARKTGSATLAEGANHLDSIIRQAKGAVKPSEWRKTLAVVTAKHGVASLVVLAVALVLTSSVLDAPAFYQSLLGRAQVSLAQVQQVMTWIASLLAILIAYLLSAYVRSLDVLRLRLSPPKSYIGITLATLAIFVVLWNLIDAEGRWYGFLQIDAVHEEFNGNKGKWVTLELEGSGELNGLLVYTGMLTSDTEALYMLVHDSRSATDGLRPVRVPLSRVQNIYGQQTAGWLR